MAACCLALATAGIQAGAETPRPARVVSINLCTDQLAMMLADEGQLLSVSDVALDPGSSAMVDEARNYVINHALAEEVYLMRPDLVLAGTYTARATVSMLRRLGMRVELFAPSDSLQDVRETITRMGEVLHQEAEAEAMLAEFDARLARLADDITRRPSAVLYYANGYTTGDQTLAGQMLLAAGFVNAATARGYTAGMNMPLEVLAMSEPDLLITGRAYPGASRSEEILTHPVVEALRQHRQGATMTDTDWVCGTPHILRAIEELAELRQQMTGQGQ